MTTRDELAEAAIHALLSTACDEDGWLSDMQYGNRIAPDFEERLIDVGIGTIDVQHAVEAVLEAVKWTPQTVSAEQVASIKAEAWDQGYWAGINGYTGPGNPYREPNVTRLRENEVKS